MDPQPTSVPRQSQSGEKNALGEGVLRSTTDKTFKKKRGKAVRRQAWRREEKRWSPRGTVEKKEEKKKKIV